MQHTHNNIPFIFNICFSPASLKLYHTWSEILNSKTLKTLFFYGCTITSNGILYPLCYFLLNSQTFLVSEETLGLLSEVEEWSSPIKYLNSLLSKSQTKLKGLCGWMVSHRNYSLVTAIWNGLQYVLLIECPHVFDERWTERISLQLMNMNMCVLKDAL